MSHSPPYISFIGFARNDSYIPNRAERHLFSLNVLMQQLKEFKIPSEILIVEWNYLENTLPLYETLRMVEASEWTTLRVIRVPPRYHRKYKFWKLKPFHVGAAVNVGIRRALGTFILPIASDIFLSDACLKQMAQQDLNEDSFYRCDRCDIDPSILNQFTSTHDFQRNEFFKRCEQLIQAHHRLLIQSPEFDIADLHTNGSGDFCLVSRKKMHEIRGFKEGKDAGGLDIDSLVLHGLHGLGCYQTILPDDCRVYKIAHSKSTAHSVHQKWRWWEKYLDAYLTKRCSIKIVNNTRMWLNYPKRQFKHIPGATFDSFETNFIKPARRWYQKKPPFYLNDEHWGLIGENLEEQGSWQVSH